MEVAGRIIEENTDGYEKEVSLCKPCSRDNKYVSTNVMCKECEEYMCRTCFGNHRKVKYCVQHTLVEQFEYLMKGKLENPELCTKHDDEKVKFFCRKHGDVGCGDCMVLGHNSCKPEYIKELSKYFRNSDDFRETKTKLDGFENDCKTAFKLIDTQRKENNLLLEKALTRLKAFRKDINEYLDNAEQKIINEANKFKSSNDSQIEKQYTLLKSTLTDVEKLQQKLNKDDHSDTALFINSLWCKSKLGDIEKSLIDAKGNQIDVFEFKPNEDISKLVSNEQQLGSLDTVSSSLVLESPNDKTSSGQSNRRKWQKSDLKPSMFKLGLRVRRGPDWNSGNEDGGKHGTVTEIFDDHSLTVTWDGSTYEMPHRAGCFNTYDVEPAEDV